LTDLETAAYYLALAFFLSGCAFPCPMGPDGYCVGAPGFKPCYLAHGALNPSPDGYCASPQSQVSLPAPYTVRGVSVTVDGLWKNGDGDVVGITGIATYAASDGRDLTVCMLTFNALDASGVKVADLIASTTGLKVGQKWRFQAMFVTPVRVNFTSIEAGPITAM